jgi:hypothetical protein
MTTDTAFGVAIMTAVILSLAVAFSPDFANWMVSIGF